MKYCFLILNYLSYWDTNNCIQSIKNLFSNYDYNIIVVDNGSSNESVKALKEKYTGDNTIHIVCTGNNLGFANGNNFGYSWGKQTISFDYLICCNNDIVFTQKEFLEIINNKYITSHYYILGPDIQKPLKRGIKHQNPHYPTLNSKQDVLEYKDFLSFRKHQFQNNLLFRYKYFLKEWMLNNGLIEDKRDDWKNEVTNVVLHGACIIFSPKFINENDWLFFPGTFMYGEEHILYYLTKMKSEISLYSPDIRVKHMHGVATKLVKNKRLERELFAIDNRIKSTDVLLEMIEKDSKKNNDQK